MLLSQDGEALFGSPSEGLTVIYRSRIWGLSTTLVARQQEFVRTACGGCGAEADRRPGVSDCQVLLNRRLQTIDIERDRPASVVESLHNPYLESM